MAFSFNPLTTVTPVTIPEVAGVNRTLAYDVFRDLDTTALHLHHANTGVWQLLTGPNSIIIDNEGKGNSFMRAFTSGVCNYAISGLPSTADYAVCLDIYVATDNNACALFSIGRLDYLGTSGYYFGLSSADNQWQLYRQLAGNFVVLAFATAVLAPGTTYATKMTFDGSTITCTVDGVPVFPAVTDANIAGPGRAGVRAANAGSRTTGLHGVRFEVIDENAVAPRSRKYALAAVGDSNFGDYGVLGDHNGTGTIPQKLAQLLEIDEVWNFAVDAQTTATANTNFAATAGAQIPVMTADRKIVMVFSGIGDHNGGADAATIITRLTTMVTAIEAAGAEAMVFTFQKNSYMTGGGETKRLAVNLAITDGTIGASLVVDIAGLLEFSDNTNALVYETDLAHMNVLGHNICAALAHSVLTSDSSTGTGKTVHADAPVLSGPVDLGPALGQKIWFINVFGGQWGVETASNNFVFFLSGTGAGQFTFRTLPTGGGSDIMTIKETGRVSFDRAEAIHLPRVTTGQRDALPSTAAALFVYNTTTGKLNVRGASAWEEVTSA